MAENGAKPIDLEIIRELLWGEVGCSNAGFAARACTELQWAKLVASQIQNSTGDGETPDIERRNPAFEIGSRKERSTPRLLGLRFADHL